MLQWLGSSYTDPKPFQTNDPEALIPLSHIHGQ